MRTKISFALLGFVFAGGIATAILSEDIVVRCIGIFVTCASLASGFLTAWDIHELQEKAKRAVYIGECVGEVNIDDSKISEVYKKSKKLEDTK